MNEEGIRVANRLGPQAQDLTWRRAESVVPNRQRWPFKVMRAEQKGAPLNESSTAENNKLSFCFTT
jgi:hypothetical protein